jgi:hypothetical protein
MRASMVCLVLALAACGEDVATAGKGTVGVADAGSSAGSSNDVATSNEEVSCIGMVIPKAAKALDSQCNFLASCATAGQCYCGNACSASQTPKCAPGVCADDHPKCFCGQECSSDKKKCPPAACAKADPLLCTEQETCAFNNAKRPEWCGCQEMPGREADCWCGACKPEQTACSPDKCAGKNPSKCIVVPGEPLKGCFCARCGLLGEAPACFEVQCPIATEP